MTEIYMLTFTGCAVLLLWNRWDMKCLWKAFEDRRHAVQLITTSPGGQYVDLIEDFYEVDPNLHYRAVLFFRDPWKLYSPRIQALVADGRLSQLDPQDAARRVS